MTHVTHATHMTHATHVTHVTITLIQVQATLDITIGSASTEGRKWNIRFARNSTKHIQRLGFDYLVYSLAMHNTWQCIKQVD